MRAGKMSRKKTEQSIEDIPGLMSLLDDLKIDLEAGSGLGLMGKDESSMKSLIDALGDDREEIRRTVVWVLGESGSDRAVEPLMECLRNEEEKAREEAMEALIKIGDPAIYPLIKVSRDPAIRGSVIVVMEGIRDSILDRRKRRMAG